MVKFKSIFSKAKIFALSHKILSILILFIIIASPFAIYHFMPKKATVRYMTQAVKKGDINVSVSGTGQVSSLKTVNLTAEVAGTVTGVYVKAGQSVNAGNLLFKIDSTDAQQKVNNAELSLENAQLNLTDLKSPADELTLVQAQNALASAQQAEANSESDLATSYDQGFNDVSSAFLDLPSIMTGLNNILFSKSINSNGSQQNIDFYTTAINYYDESGTQYRDDAYNKYVSAKAKYDASLADYKAASRFSDKATIESLINEVYDTTKAIADAIKSSNNLIDFYKYTLTNKQQSYNPAADNHLSTLNNYTSETNSHLSSLLSAENTIIQDKNNIISSEGSIKEKQLSLQKIQDGATDSEIKSQELSVEQQKENLSEAQDTLSKYSITAPFSGIMSSVSAEKGDEASSGTALGSIITDKMIATVTLNEVDIAKVQVGQKVKLSFDALDNVVVDGEVSEVDTTGTVSQGVVSYSVKIAFDAGNQSIKPGMSISANIITDSVSGVLTIPASAVKNMGGKSYVQVMDSTGKMTRKAVETGLTDDTSIEIKSGLSEGDKVVTNTIIGSTTKKAATSTTTTTTNARSTSGQEVPGGGSFMMLTR